MTVLEVAGVTVPQPDSVLIAGEWVRAGGAAYEIVSPATGLPVAEVTLPSQKDALSAVDAALDLGRGSWGGLPVAVRVALCSRFCALLESRLAEMGTVWAVEAGIPVRYSRTLHKYGALSAWKTALASAESVLRDDRRRSPLGEVLVRRDPAGVVVAIMPYNGPLVTVATKVIPALLAGCPVIVKAAVESQLIMRIVAGCAAAAGLPAGALSILCGDADVGRVLAGSAHVDMASLTAPYGGVKRSGWGREAGPEGIIEFTELKQIVLGPEPDVNRERKPI